MARWMSLAKKSFAAERRQTTTDAENSNGLGLLTGKGYLRGIQIETTSTVFLGLTMAHLPISTGEPQKNSGAQIRGAVVV